MEKQYKICSFALAFENVLQIFFTKKCSWWSRLFLFSPNWDDDSCICDQNPSIYAWIYTFEEDVILTSNLIQPITAICLAVNHPSCSNSFCVLSQSAFRPHTHISIAFKVRGTSLHFIPPSLFIHPSLIFLLLHLERITPFSPLGSSQP